MAFLDEIGLTRLWNKIEGKFSQFSGNIENTYTKPNTDGNLVLYVSKQGSDNNDGLTQQTPLLTIEKAFEIAGKNLPLNTEGVLSLCVGPGEWGDLILGAKPYIIKLYSFNYTDYYTELSDIPNLPHFTTITVRCSIQCYNINVDSFDVKDNAYGFLSNMCVVGQVTAHYEGVAYFGGSPTTLLIKNTNQSYVFGAEKSAAIILSNTTNIKVIESLTLSVGFYYAVTQSRIHGMHNNSNRYSYANDATVTGYKANIGNGSQFSYVGSILNNIPGTGTLYENGAIIDGVTVGDTTHPGNKTFTGSININTGTTTLSTYDNPFIISNVHSGASANSLVSGLIIRNAGVTKGVFDDTKNSMAYTQILFGDASGNLESPNQYGRLAMIEHSYTVGNTSNSHTCGLSMSCYKNITNSTDRATISINYDASGNAYTSAPTPAIADNSTKIATTAFVRTANPIGTTYVDAVTVGKGLLNLTHTAFGTVFNAPTKNYRVGLATWPATNDNVILYSVTKANVTAGTNTVAKQMIWNADTGVLSTSGGFSGNVTGNCSGTSSNVTGIVAMANGGTGRNSYANSNGVITVDNTNNQFTAVATANGALYATAANGVSKFGTLPIAQGGTGATTRLNAAKALTNENVGASPNYFVTMTSSWGKFGYSSVANAKTALGISGSDRRIKDDINDISESILDAWKNVDWKQFKMKKDVRLLGENAKLHFGAVVQDIQSVFSNSDIDSSKYGFLYQEDYPEEERDLPSDENSEVTNGDKWYLKYEEALCIEAAYQRRRADRLEKELNALKEQVKEILEKINL